MPLMPLKCEVLPGNRSTDHAPEAGPEVGPDLAPEVTEVTPDLAPEAGPGGEVTHALLLLPHTTSQGAHLHLGRGGGGIG